jgi:hypothetical protein
VPGPDDSIDPIMPGVDTLCHHSTQPALPHPLTLAIIHPSTPNHPPIHSLQTFNHPVSTRDSPIYSTDSSAISISYKLASPCFYLPPLYNPPHSVTISLSFLCPSTPTSCLGSSFGLFFVLSLSIKASPPSQSSRTRHSFRVTVCFHSLPIPGW